MNRREAIKAAAATSAAVAFGNLRSAWGAQGPALREATPTPTAAEPATGPFTLPPLPYAAAALEPHIDAQTMMLHHDKHHATYVKNLNAALVGQAALASEPIEKILQQLDEVPESIRKVVRNNGGGHFNHTLFWQMMSPKGGGEPTGALAKALTAKFGGVAEFKAMLTKEATGIFGSGWAWLILDGQELALETTANQDNPISTGKTPLLGVDVWEHAYYLQHQNRRPEYLTAWWNVVNWDFIAQRYDQARAS